MVYKCNNFLGVRKMIDNENGRLGEDSTSIVLYPVGIIRNSITEPFLVAGNDGIKMREHHKANMKQIREMHEETSEVIIDKELIDILEGIEEYSHLIILYWAHKVPNESRSLTKVHPTGRECFSKVGIFATCSPARPNPVLMTVVRLCGIRDNVLKVKGLDAVDGSPVIDIKPYLGKHCPPEEISIPEWMKQIQKEFNENSSKNP